MTAMKKLSLAIIAAASLTLAGCSTAQPEQETAPQATTDSPPAETSPAEYGTQDNPWPLGKTVPVGDWEITINSWQPNVNDLVSAAGDDMSMLEEGQQYALLNVTMTWNGDGPGDISLVSMQYDPTGGNTISNAWSAFGTTPGDNKLAFQELTTGGTVTGDMLFSVDEGNTDGVFLLGSATAATTQYAAVK